MPKIHELLVELGGDRLDRFIAESLPELSRSKVKRLVLRGLVTVDGLEAKSSNILFNGQHVSVTIPDPEPHNIEPQPIPLKIVYDDSDLIVISKPAGLAVHPGPGHPDHTLVNAVLARVPDITNAGNILRPGIVHRLDKDTSGLIVIAKNDWAHANLSLQFKERSVCKEYKALVRGVMESTEAIIDAPIGRHPLHRKRMAVISSGRPAVTRYKTGRTHQIRVHLASIGHPVAGDTVYGHLEPGLNRQFLHATRLGFRLPSSGDKINLREDLPDDLENFLQTLETD
jgi:23S rRNA pseudouridine1911/1915/1917 synthase